MKTFLFTLTAFFAIGTLCAEFNITSKPFGKTKDGKDVIEYTISNSDMSVSALNYGGVITEINVPDSSGNIENITPNFKTVAEYENSTTYFGAFIGRYGNRIANAKFELNGKTYKLGANENGKCLHGGVSGFNDKIYKVDSERGKNYIALIFTRVSPDGEEGFPGKLAVSVKYVLTDKNQLVFIYNAKSDADTVCNLTQHTYFNLTGKLQPITKHTLQIDADFITPVDKNLIPTGAFKGVENTAFDFRTAKEIGKDIMQNDEQLALGGGYDHNFVLSKGQTGDMQFAAALSDPQSGRIMNIYTTEPGLQFYSGNFLDGKIKDAKGRAINYRCGLALETQHFPDSPNRKNFPSTVLKKGQEYVSATMYEFKAKSFWDKLDIFGVFGFTEKKSPKSLDILKKSVE